MRTRISLGAALIAAALAAHPATAQDKPKKKPPEIFPGLTAALKKSPGFLGMESAVTRSRKNVLFIWFKDKKAAVAWYNSDYHQKVMAKFFPKRVGGEPLKGVAEGTGPILAIASITLTDKPKVAGTKLPISQIAIELYTPLKGGLAVGGSFAPKFVQAKAAKK